MLPNMSGEGHNTANTHPAATYPDSMLEGSIMLSATSGAGCVIAVWASAACCLWHLLSCPVVYDCKHK